MNLENFRTFLNGSIGLCLVMAVLSLLLRWRKFGPAALALSGAFLVMALLLYGLSQEWPQSRIVGVGVVLAICLVADGYLRSSTDLKR